MYLRKEVNSMKKEYDVPDITKMTEKEIEEALSKMPKIEKFDIDVLKKMDVGIYDKEGRLIGEIDMDDEYDYDE